LAPFSSVVLFISCFAIVDIAKANLSIFHFRILSSSKDISLARKLISFSKRILKTGELEEPEEKPPARCALSDTLIRYSTFRPP
jgi:hypothetical protein